MIGTERSAAAGFFSASARILGAITREVWAERPELREGVGREWTHGYLWARALGR